MPDQGIMLRCGKCRDMKPSDEFYREKKGRHGRGWWCIACCRAYSYAYRRTPAGRAAAAGGCKKGYVRQLVRSSVYHAIKTGRLVRGPCESCGSTEHVHGHHDSYEDHRRLDVRWLCARCRLGWHSNNKPIPHPSEGVADDDDT